MMDLLIVGGGPAGCAAAIHAHAYGLQATILDSPQRTRRLPGETVAPGVEPILQQLGVWQSILTCQFHRHTGIWRVGVDGLSQFDAYGGESGEPWKGLQLDRLIFHGILRERARELGALWVAAKASSVSRDSSTSWTVRTRDGHTHRATTLIDASGRNAWMAKQLQLASKRVGGDQRVIYGWTRRATNESDLNPVLTQRHDGWDWLAHIDDQQAAWVKLRNGPNAIGLDVTPRIYLECAGDNWFLVGDAACGTTPASGNGILRALMTGIYAAHLATATALGQITSRDAFETYRKWVFSFWESSVNNTPFTLSKIPL